MIGRGFKAEYEDSRQWIRKDEGIKWRKVSRMAWSRLKFSCIIIEPHYEMPITVS